MITTRWKAHRLVVLAACVLAGCSWPVRAALGGEQLDSRRFLDTYRTALRRLEAACGSGYLEGVYTSQWFGARADRPEREATLDMAYGSDGDREKHVLIRRDLAFPPDFERVFLPRSGRTLILERLDPARPFYIRWISKPSEAPDNMAPIDRRDVIARAAYSIGGGFLIPSILDSPSFQLIELGRVDREGASQVRLVFKSRSDAAKSLPELDDYPWDTTEGRPEGRGSSQLMVDTRVLYFDRPAPKTSIDLSFQLTNSGPKPVRVVGWRCGCAATLPAEDLPCRIEPGQSKRLTLKLRGYSETETGETKFPLYLYTTAPGQAEVELTLVGRRNTGN